MTIFATSARLQLSLAVAAALCGACDKQESGSSFGPALLERQLDEISDSVARVSTPLTFVECASGGPDVFLLDATVLWTPLELDQSELNREIQVVTTYLPLEREQFMRLARVVAPPPDAEGQRDPECPGPIEGKIQTSFGASFIDLEEVLGLTPDEAEEVLQEKYIERGSPSIGSTSAAWSDGTPAP